MFTNHAIKCFRDVFDTQGKTSLKVLKIQHLGDGFESPMDRIQISILESK